MVLSNKGLELLNLAGFDSAKTYKLPDNPDELNTSSTKSFMDQHTLAHSAESLGQIHVTGPKVVGNSAPIKGLGEFLSSLQLSIDSIGASFSGNKTTKGSLPSSVTGRTELSLVASPMPGSVVLVIAPSLSRSLDLYPEGDALFDLEDEIGAKPLADKAFLEFVQLLDELNVDTPDNNKFVEHLSDLGPRVASSFQSFCESIDRGSLDIDFEWKEPGQKRKRASLTHSVARQLYQVIENADIASETVFIEGVLLTVTTSEKDHLRVRVENEDSVVEETLHIGSIAPTALCRLQAGDRVMIEAERRVSLRAGGRQSKKLIGISIEKISSLLDGL